MRRHNGSGSTTVNEANARATVGIVLSVRRIDLLDTATSALQT